MSLDINQPIFPPGTVTAIFRGERETVGEMIEALRDKRQWFDDAEAYLLARNSLDDYKASDLLRRLLRLRSLGVLP